MSLTIVIGHEPPELELHTQIQAVRGPFSYSPSLKKCPKYCYIALQEKDEDEATKLIALVKSWPVTWIYPDERLLLQAGKIKATYRLSVADAIIAAVAKLRQAKLVHKDPELAALATEVSLMTLPFKKKTSQRVRRVRRIKGLKGQN